MTIPITSCCCAGTPAPGTCGDICDCAATYNLVTWSLTFAGVKQELVVNPCNSPCDQYDGPEVKGSSSLAITGVNLGTAVLQRYTEPGGNCCYQAQGTVRLTVGWDYVADFYCCGVSGQEPPGGCTYSTGLDAVVDVPYCLTAVCANHPITGELGLKWVLIICSFSIGQASVVVGGDPCFGYTDCEAPPLGNVWVLVGPARYSWWTKLKCPKDLVQPLDYQYFSLCWGSTSSCGPPIPGQDPVGYGTSCAYEQEFVTSVAGPFAINFRTAALEPDMCSHISVTSCTGFFFPCYCSGYGKDLLLGACQGQVDFASDCCEVTMSTGIVYPIIT